MPTRTAGMKCEGLFSGRRLGTLPADAHLPPELLNSDWGSMCDQIHLFACALFCRPSFDAIVTQLSWLLQEHEAAAARPC